MSRTIGRLPPLNALRAFVVAGRHLSFSRAAEELNVTPAAVSQQVRQLEDHLGCALFRRATRQLLLTDEGQACLPGLAEGFEKLAEALAAIENLDEGGQLTLSVAPSFAGKWLLPRIDAFAIAHPEIDVRISAAMQVVDFDAEDVDCAIRYGGGDYPGLEVDKLLSESVVPVCSPALLEGGEPLETPVDLRRFTLLHDDGAERDASCPDWAMWLKAAGVEGVDATRGPRFDQSSLVLEAAVLGRGVALAKERLAEADLRAGKLVRLFDLRQPLAFAYYFVCPPRKRGLRRVQAMRAWLLSQAVPGPLDYSI
ncbi:transcriptional regulator GcvA [Geminicoccaceae bacterium 1502E]|nr:transcriptional regulator GcvA [Geminicoccaceae bacterium 1502E]